MKKITYLLILITLFSYGVDIKSKKLYNESAYVVSQCYTKTKDEKGKVHNPCFNCHINSKEPNYANDYILQQEYSFKEYALKNRWKNLFKDRRDEIAKISDSEILAYVKKSNYFDKNGDIALAKKLKNLPSSWDIDGDKKWDGYIPDCYFSFDKEGFDRDKNGNFTGWRAFGYYPFLGTFWPTNGSTDDVLIRLHKDFQKDENGKFDLETYKVNLAIVEALIKQKNIKTFDINESKYGVDLNKDNKLSIAKEIVFQYDPNSGKNMSYVGLAKKKGYKIAAGLYPVGTEFLHTVRYLDVVNNKVAMAPRLKELRYGKKTRWATYAEHKEVIDAELTERIAFPDRLETFIGDAQSGISNKRGWIYQGFIEDKNGELRPQTYEENLNCIGCHSNLGATADSTFVFQRKLEKNSFQDGWFHWSQKDFKNIPEPKTPDGRYEYTLYLEQNGAGDEFRENSEIKNKFFTKSGKLKKDEVKKIRDDISYLLMPTPKRAILLNKAYKVIVDEQSFIYGRDAVVKPLKNVHKELNEDEKTGVKKPVIYTYPAHNSKL